MAEPPVPYLLKLHPELQLQIVQHLIDFVYIEPEGGTDDEDPPTTWQQDLRDWSSVSSYFRALLAPYFFTEITLRNTVKSGKSVDLIIGSPYVQYIRVFRFEGHAPGNEEEGFSDTGAILPGIVESILSNLDRFPKLDMVSVKFPLEMCGWRDPYMMFSKAEQEGDMVQAENEEAWRYLNTRVYAAVARNLNPKFSKLELLSLNPVEASSFSTDEFRNLLGVMTNFTLSLWEDENSAGYGACLKDGYCEYTERFDELFFNHLTSVTSFTLHPNDLFLGSPSSGSLKLNRSQMPLLSSLYLRTIFINPQLVDFLTSHAQTLEEIVLDDCYAGTANDSYHIWNPIVWADLFAALYNKNPRRLHEFDVRVCSLPLRYMCPNTVEGRIEAEFIRETMETHPKRKLFTYTLIDVKFGTPSDVWDDILNSFRLGHDQIAYDNLISLVKNNSVERLNGPARTSV